MLSIYAHKMGPVKSAGVWFLGAEKFPIYLVIMNLGAIIKLILTMNILPSVVFPDNVSLGFHHVNGNHPRTTVR